MTAPAWLIDAGEAAAALAAIGGVVGGVGALAVRAERRWRRLANGLFGDEHSPGLLVRLDRVEAASAQIREQVAAVLGQLSPDHGASTHDAVVRIDERTTLLSERMDVLGAGLAGVVDRLDRHERSPH